MSRKETTARERATMIVQVQAGRMTVKEAAEALEISPKTYHEWEKRALESMMEGLTNREPGRPSSSPDPEVLKLQRKVKELETHVMIMEKTAELRAHLLAEAKLKEQTKKKGELMDALVLNAAALRQQHRLGWERFGKAVGH